MESTIQTCFNGNYIQFTHVIQNYVLAELVIDKTTQQVIVEQQRIQGDLKGDVRMLWDEFNDMNSWIIV